MESHTYSEFRVQIIKRQALDSGKELMGRGGKGYVHAIIIMTIQ